MDENVQIEVLQTIFLIFYAVFWGGIFNVQARWKAFQWPLLGFRPARHRTLMSFLILNLVPIIFFAVAMWALKEPIPARTSTWIVLLQYTRGVVAAFAVFGIYRIWFGVIECWPEIFYASKVTDIPERYQHVEPTFRHRWTSDPPKGPVVDLGADTGCRNVVVGILYVIVALIVLFVPNELTALCKPFFTPTP